MKNNIATPTVAKKETPEGLWYQCKKCKSMMTADEHKENIWVCPTCEHHERINSPEYFSFLFDNGKYTELSPKLISGDPLKFEDTKKYKDRLIAAKSKTGLHDAVSTGYGKMEDIDVVIACMNFNFIGGSMGSVVGEKISRAIDHCIKYEKPFILISKSGGARMMEAALSLMQMAKTSAKLTLLADAGMPFISFLTDPTTGGVTASYAMLGDINISEPNALIGFAGPRVVKETIGRDLPKGFQTAEFVLEHGFLDYIVERKNMKQKIAQSIRLFLN
jgi:acetyl-CoA carboxylase carboxyl transferase subunit beta